MPASSPEPTESFRLRRPAPEPFSYSRWIRRTAMNSSEGGHERGEREHGLDARDGADRRRAVHGAGGARDVGQLRASGPAGPRTGRRQATFRSTSALIMFISSAVTFVDQPGQRHARLVELRGPLGADAGPEGAGADDRLRRADRLSRHLRRRRRSSSPSSCRGSGNIRSTRSCRSPVLVPLLLFMMFEVWFLVPLPKGPLEAMLGY